jgi:hypothetical protein
MDATKGNTSSGKWGFSFRDDLTDCKELEIGAPHIPAFNVGRANFSVAIFLCRASYEN